MGGLGGGAGAGADFSMTAPAALAQTGGASLEAQKEQIKAAQQLLKEGNLEMVRRLQTANPLLQRPFVLRAASGRYTRDMPVDRTSLAVMSLPMLRPHTFDSFITEVMRPDQLLVVLLYRGDSQEHVWAEQLMQYVNGALGMAAAASQGLRWPEEKPRPDTLAYRITKYEMSQSRFLVKRYNVKTLPAYVRERRREAPSCRNGEQVCVCVLNLPLCGCMLLVPPIFPVPAPPRLHTGACIGKQYS